MQCRKCSQEFNPETVIVWGKEVKTVNCVSCRKSNREFASYNKSFRRKEEIWRRNHDYKACAEKNIVCTNFEW